MREVRLSQAIMLVGITFLVGVSSSLAKNVHSDSLPPDKAKVIVTFEDEIKANTVEKYGEVLKRIKIINGVVAVINRDSIETLKNEDGIKDVVIDSKILFVPPEPRELIGPPDKAFETLDATDIIVGWNLQEPGIAASNTPHYAVEPNSIGAWETFSVDGEGVIIAILDTGVNYNLEDLNTPNYLGGYDFINDDDDPMDDNWDLENDHYGHGTVVSTIALAQGIEKIKGVAPSVSYYALKVLDDQATSDMSHVILALDWCVNTANPKPDIVNMSLGIFDPPAGLMAQLETACTAAYNAGIILIAASGNTPVGYAAYPAACTNVISVGGHDEDQTLYVNSSGGVDLVAPAGLVPSMDMTGDATWRYNGTSNAAPHIAGMGTLVLQYVLENDIDINNGYFFKLVKHSAIDLGLDPIYQGKGKARAKESIDLIASHWPVEYEFEFTDYAFADANLPVYHIGADANQSITLTNITHISGNDIENIENLTITVNQTEYDDPNILLGGNSIKVFPTISNISPGDANSIELSYSYTIPPDTTPGLKKTTLQLEFNFVGNSRAIQISYNNPDSAWYAAIPGDFNLSNTVSLPDFSTLSQNWQDTGCSEPDYCNRADVDKGGTVDLPDVCIVAENWLTGR